jgi:FlaA1/EpsC-like NDP-sugar epimerase
MVIAIPSADATTIRALRDAADAAGVRAMVVPPFSALVGGTLSARDIRDINLEDLLGRRRITLDESAIRAHLKHKTVLVTGAGGSIGSELCRQIARFDPARLVMVDRDESALQSVQLDLSGHGLLDSDGLVLADIRDRETIRRVFATHRPEVVFHAAALKHLPLLERYPLEAWKSNVIGTLNVLRAAADIEVETFVNISTDKAADPTCVLGVSKRIAERLTADIAQRQSGRFLSVRFGNVLGSRGSVIPAFTYQIQHGGPVTVTHRDVERYFMLIPEACQLVMQAAVIGRPGEVMVLDMGQQIKIREIAETLISLSGRKDVEIVYTGLRPGEKMTEDLFNATDEARATAHPLVSTVDALPLPAASVDALPSSPEEAAEWLRGLATHGNGPFAETADAAKVRRIRPA